jgi:hypothetical protein
MRWRIGMGWALRNNGGERQNFQGSPINNKEMNQNVDHEMIGFYERR